MNAREAYVWMKRVDHEAMAAFFTAYGGIRVFPAGNDLVRLVIDADHEDVDFQRLRELAVQEFIQDLTVLVVPESPDFPVSAVLADLPRLGHGVFGASELATEAVLRNLTPLRGILRSYYYDLVGAETVDTAVGFIKADQNATRAARRMFMHRNTLNYRLDHFAAKTGIDVRTFSGGLACYLLFRA